MAQRKGDNHSGQASGRPATKAVENHGNPGERNPIEGEFCLAKNGYGMNKIRARLAQTNESMIVSIILVLNLVKMPDRHFFA
jgi:IS5 family transposase